MRIYVASSWRNPHFEQVVACLLSCGHLVWNWKNPPTGGDGFRWQDAGQPHYGHGDALSAAAINETLNHPVALRGFASDLCGMNWCDVGVLLYPSGRSAHLEAGWLAGRGKTVHSLMLDPTEPDLMVHLLNGKICGSIAELLHAL